MNVQLQIFSTLVLVSIIYIYIYSWTQPAQLNHWPSSANVREMFRQSCYKNDVIIIHLNSTKWIILQRKRGAETYLVAVGDEDEVRVTVSGWSDDTSMMNAKAFSSVCSSWSLRPSEQCWELHLRCSVSIVVADEDWNDRAWSMLLLPFLVFFVLFLCFSFFCWFLFLLLSYFPCLSLSFWCSPFLSIFCVFLLLSVVSPSLLVFPLCCSCYFVRFPPVLPCSFLFVFALTCASCVVPGPPVLVFVRPMVFSPLPCLFPLFCALWLWSV